MRYSRAAVVCREAQMTDEKLISAARARLSETIASCERTLADHEGKSVKIAAPPGTMPAEQFYGGLLPSCRYEINYCRMLNRALDALAREPKMEEGLAGRSYVIERQNERIAELEARERRVREVLEKVLAWTKAERSVDEGAMGIWSFSHRLIAVLDGKVMP